MTFPRGARTAAELRGARVVRALLSLWAMSSLLERLGGRDGLTVVVAGLVARLEADPRLAGRLVRCEAELVDAFAALLGGGRAPPGALRWSWSEQAAVLACLIDTLSAAGVGCSLRQEVVCQIACVSSESRRAYHA